METEKDQTIKNLDFEVWCQLKVEWHRRQSMAISSGEKGPRIGDLVTEAIREWLERQHVVD